MTQNLDYLLKGKERLGNLKLIDGLPIAIGIDQDIFENRRTKKSVHSGAMELFFCEACLSCLWQAGIFLKRTVKLSNLLF